MSNSIVDDVVNLFRERGSAMYGGEAVTQLEHALQAATLASAEQADSTLIAAALLHDVGHLLHNLPEDAAAQGIDDRHEQLGQRWLEKHFGPAVHEPVRLHVAAKRYLCAAEPAYRRQLSPASELSLQVQGGPMTMAERAEFESHPFYREAVRLRRWDDEAKVVDLQTPDLESFRPHLMSSLADGHTG